MSAKYIKYTKFVKYGKYTKNIKDINNCKNNLCFCLEYLNFSNKKHIDIYNECFKINRCKSNIMGNVISPKMMEYLKKVDG